MLWLPLAVALAVIVTVFQTELRENYPAWAVLTAGAFVTVVGLALMPRFSDIIRVFADMAKLGDVGSVYLTPVLKTIAAAYITSFGVVLSREAGEEAVASAIELVGKAVILLMAVPLVQAIFVSLLGLLDF